MKKYKRIDFEGFSVNDLSEILEIRQSKNNNIIFNKNSKPLSIEQMFFNAENKLKSKKNAKQNRSK